MILLHVSREDASGANGTSSILWLCSILLSTRKQATMTCREREHLFPLLVWLLTSNEAPPVMNIS